MEGARRTHPGLLANEKDPLEGWVVDDSVGSGPLTPHLVRLRRLPTLRILLLDDSPCSILVREALSRFDGVHFEDEAKKWIQDGFSDPFQVVLVGTCGSDGERLGPRIDALADRFPGARIAVLACALTAAAVKSALDAGVDGIVSRHLKDGDLLDSLGLSIEDSKS